MFWPVAFKVMRWRTLEEPCAHHWDRWCLGNSFATPRLVDDGACRRQFTGVLNPCRIHYTVPCSIHTMSCPPQTLIRSCFLCLLFISFNIFILKCFFGGFLFNKFHKIKRYLKNSEDIMMSGMVGHRWFFRNFIRSKDCLSVSLASTKDIAGKHALVPWSLRGFCL